MARVTIAEIAAGGAAFGTSGVRGTVEALTDRVCLAYAAAFLQEVAPDARRVAIGWDLRPSSPRIVGACLAACAARGVEVTACGALPTPALAHHAIQRGVPAIMVTGSHIPFDRNGIKFYRSTGEIQKDDEAAIARATVALDPAAFGADGMLLSPPPPPHVEPAAADLYRARYRAFFPPGLLAGKRVGVYQHSSVARDLLAALLADLGAEVVPLGRTESFVPVDTEAISERDERLAREWTAAHRLDALASTDGDADRPLLADETGALLRGDVVGMLCAEYVGARTVVTPVSSNTAVERWGRFDRVLRTRIGSPYVLAAIGEAVAAGEGPVAGYEANGGFLLGSEIRRDGRALAALPTRDAALPILAILALAAERGCGLSRLAADLPARHTASDRLQDVPAARSKALLDRLAESPAQRAAFFAELGEVVDVNLVDGVRVTLAGGDVVHLRPSGNAPELRCYAEAGTPARAGELTRWGLRAAAAQG
jgi:phosphomannomutase